MFDDYIRFHAALRPDELAVLSHGGRWNYARFEAMIRRAVHLLRDIPVPPGESVSVVGGDPFLDWVLILALARLGVASGAFEDPHARYRIGRHVPPGEHTLLLTADHLTYISNGPEHRFLRVEPDPDALGHVFRTSGTTGEPKRVGISWRAMNANIQQIVASHVGIGGTWFGATGIATQLGFNYATAAWVGGHAAVVGFGPVPDVFLQAQPRLIAFVPAQIQFLLDGLPADHVPWPLRIVSGGSAFPQPLARAVCERLTSDVFLNYACTEASQLATATLDIMEKEPRAAGFLRPGVEVRVLDEAGAELPPNEQGRLSFRTGRLTSGYLDDPERTAACYRHGWFISNDVGYLRDDGLLVLEGRADEIMNLGGLKVPPDRIERALLRLDGIREAAAFPIAGESGLNRCGVAIVADPLPDPADLSLSLSGLLTPIQRISLFVVDCVARNAMGKIDRPALAAALRDATPLLTTAGVPHRRVGLPRAPSE